MIGKIFKFARKNVAPSETSSEYCFGKLELPALSPWSQPAASEQRGETASEAVIGEHHGENVAPSAAVRLPAMRRELAHAVGQERDYGGGVIASMLVAAIGVVLFLLLLV
jgi:hypothetical protein